MSSSQDQFGPVAEIYDDLMSVVPYRWWVDYVERLWARFDACPRRVLDLACGTGNVLDELLKRGYEAEGADYSGAMLSIARRKLPRDTPLWQQDARALEIPGPPFDACVCLFDSLNYILKLEELRRAFAGVRRHLRPGGLFIFDMNAIRALEMGMFDQTGTGRDASLRYEWHSAWEPATRLCTIRMEFRHATREGVQVLHETHVQRGYTLPEITGALREEELDLLAVFDAYTMHPPTPKSDRYYVIARRPPEHE